MAGLEVVIRQVAADGAPLAEVARFAVPEANLVAAAVGTGLDVLETHTQQVGQAILQRLLQAHWEAADAAAVAAHRRAFPPGALDLRRDG